MKNMMDLSNYRMTIMDKIVSEGTLAFLKSMGEKEREETLRGALRQGFDALFFDAREWNMKVLSEKDGEEAFRYFMDLEYAAVWRELDPKSFSNDLIPEFYRVFEDYLSHFKDAE